MRWHALTPFTNGMSLKTSQKRTNPLRMSMNPRQDPSCNCHPSRRRHLPPGSSFQLESSRNLLQLLRRLRSRRLCLPRSAEAASKIHRSAARRCRGRWAELRWPHTIRFPVPKEFLVYRSLTIQAEAAGGWWADPSITTAALSVFTKWR